MESSSPAKIEKIITILRDHFNLSPDTAQVEPRLGPNLRYRPDLTLEDHQRLIIVELKDAARFEAVSQLYFYKKILQESDNREIVAVLMARAIRPEIAHVAEDHDVHVIRLPPDVNVYDRSPVSIENKAQKTKVTSDKSWKVVSSLLKNKFTTIRQISLKEGISYGLAHLVVKNLEAQGIIEAKAGYFEVVDTKKLLNGIAWERPFERLRYGEFKSYHDDSYAAARDISNASKENGIQVAFTGHTAGSLYTGYGIRFDAAYTYVKKEDFERFRNMFSGSLNEGGKGVTIHVYSPDRDVFGDIRELESVTVVSPAQALLDLAGLGYSGMDMTKAMVEAYANLQ
jgi:hypothetical protein